MTLDFGSGWLVTLNMAVNAALAVIGWSIRRNVTGIDLRITDHEDRLREIEGRFPHGRCDDHESRVRELESDTVRHEEWLRETGMARQRQEQIHTAILEIKAQQDVGRQIGPAVDQIVAVLKERAA